MALLQEIYIGCSVFSVGITVLDFLGFLGGGEDSDGEGIGPASEVDGDEVDGGDLTADIDHTADAASGHTSDYGGAMVLSVIFYLRGLVYFCLGFGPTGWVAMATGRGMESSLLWALPAGAISFVLVCVFFRFLRSDIDSSLHTHDLLFQRAVVIVPLSHTTMGKIRVKVGMNVTDQYALTAEPDTQFEKGDVVWITNVTEDCVYVEDDFTGKE